MTTLKRSILLFLIAIVLLLPMITHAEGIDLRSYAVSNLTEVLGYTAEEAAQFVFDEKEDGSIAFWHPDHPDWIYTVSVNRKTGQIVGTSPFDTGYFMFRGENAVRVLMHTIREKGWFVNWNAESRSELLSFMEEAYDIRISTELYFADDAGKAVHGFFESCYGSEFGWPEPLHQLYRGMMDEYHLTWEAEPFYLPGRCRVIHGLKTGLEWDRMAILFEGTIPADWQFVFDDPHLEGWQCHSGVIVAKDGSQSDQDPLKNGGGYGLAAFEKDGHRQLIQIVSTYDGWKIYPLGENSMVQSGDYRVTFDGLHRSIAVEYPLNEDEMASFYLSPSVNPESIQCRIDAYERLNKKTGEAVWIAVASTSMPTWQREHDELSITIKARFPDQIGIVPIDLFPTTKEEALQNNYPGLPENYVLVNGVNFRTQTSSRSRSYGELKAGVMIPVLDIVPGDPNDWIHTRIGALEGYVVSSYTSIGGRLQPMTSTQPVAKAKKEIEVKNGTGWFDGSAGTFPAGTRMHVVFEDGDWLYVDIPQGEMNWLMDPEGTFGYVRKSDVIQAATACHLDWMDE